MHPSDWDDWTSGDWTGDDFTESPPDKGPPMRANNRYRDAYGEYSGGYGPRSGFRGPSGCGPNAPFDNGPPRFGPRGFGPRGFGPRGFGPRGPVPHFMMGRGFGPGGPPMRQNKNYEDRTIKYLIRCGMAKANLKNLPFQFLQLIEPHRCGVCAMEFDSAPLSRVHYSSKNHLKNQKKWMTQFASERFSGPTKELPMKARELYCELCDVQITSKAHADAHYAGKPHRAIVEGRKMPKNPFLNQPGMESRVTQLIRREKRQLKTEAPPPAEATPLDVKPPPPELYCDICKTTVTCTEQMTMHLNGKKHLAKEKSHILKMMKAGCDKDQPMEAENGNMGEPQDNDANLNKNGEQQNGADQSGSQLSGADTIGEDQEGAQKSGAEPSGSEQSGAEQSGANVGGAGHGGEMGGAGDGAEWHEGGGEAWDKV